MTVLKEQLTERRRGKGGSLVRVVKGKWASAQIRVVKDLMQRKSCNMPSRIGVGPLDRGIAFGVKLDEIELLPTYETYWIARGGDGSSDVIIQVHVVNGRVLVDEIERKAMAEGIRGEDAEFAAEIAALPEDGGLIDVTSVINGGTREWLMDEYGIEIDKEVAA